VIEKVVHGLMSGGWRRGTVSGPQRLQPDAWTAPDLSATAPVLDSVKRAEARCCEQRLCGRRPAPHLAPRTVILVDDGLATGATMRAAIRSVRQAGPARLLVAVRWPPSRRTRRCVPRLTS
jgi:hypothetical protein